MACSFAWSHIQFIFDSQRTGSEATPIVMIVHRVAAPPKAGGPDMAITGYSKTNEGTTLF
jgi:hypothetical protein